MAVLGGGTAVETYAHNHEGRRIEIEDAAANVRAFVHDERSVIEAYDAGSLSRRHRYADRLIGLSTAAGTYALHLDPLGSILELTDQTSGERSWCRITCTASGPCPMGMAISRCGGG